MMKELIENGKLVELTYSVTDKKSGQILNTVEFPISYIHGHNDVLTPNVLEELEGKTAKDAIDVHIYCDSLFGPRDESLVFTDRIENVPEEYRKLGAMISMENKKGNIKNFFVTRIDETTLTVDGNNPLCGRDVVFNLEILNVRNATEEEIEAGGKDQDAEHDPLEGELASTFKTKPIY